MAESSVILRPFELVQDQAFIYATWRNHAFYSLPCPPDDPADFFHIKTQKIRDILANANVLIACLADSKETIIGYIVYDTEDVYFMYVKKDFRNIGIEGMLLTGSIYEALR